MIAALQVLGGLLVLIWAVSELGGERRSGLRRRRPGLEPPALTTPGAARVMAGLRAPVRRLRRGHRRSRPGREPRSSRESDDPSARASTRADGAGRCDRRSRPRERRAFSTTRYRSCRSTISSASRISWPSTIANRRGFARMASYSGRVSWISRVRFRRPHSHTKVRRPPDSWPASIPSLTLRNRRLVHRDPLPALSFHR